MTVMNEHNFWDRSLEKTLASTVSYFTYLLHFRFLDAATPDDYAGTLRCAGQAHSRAWRANLQLTSLLLQLLETRTITPVFRNWAEYIPWETPLAISKLSALSPRFFDIYTQPFRCFDKRRAYPDNNAKANSRLSAYPKSFRSNHTRPRLSLSTYPAYPGNVRRATFGPIYRHSNLIARTRDHATLPR